VGTLGPDEILIAKTGMPLIRARKHFYFRDRVLRQRAAVPVPERERRAVGERPVVVPILPRSEGAPPVPLEKERDRTRDAGREVSDHER
jgi:type IV secretory pathway TraG/TraD family ATPase VirD4